MGTTDSGRRPSVWFTLLFGAIYFLFKGWLKAAIAALLIIGIAAFTIGPYAVLVWVPIACFSKKFVDALEG